MDNKSCCSSDCFGRCSSTYCCSDEDSRRRAPPPAPLPVPPPVPPVVVEGDNVNVDLDGLIEYISELLDLIKERKKRSRPNAAHPYWPKDSIIFNKLRDILSEGINVAKDIIPGASDAKTVAAGLLRGLGTAHLVTAGLLVVANILERFHEVEANQNECLRLLKKMNKLAKYVKLMKGRIPLVKRMGDLIEVATELIVEGSLMCCTQIDKSKFSRFFSATVNNELLVEFKQQLEDMYSEINAQMVLYTQDIATRKLAPVPRRDPLHAVGIEQAVEDVIGLLQCGSIINAMAVIVIGSDGIGKTTLTDAVFSRVKFEGCTYSKIRLFNNRESRPNIVELQKIIVKDLIEPGMVIPPIRQHEDGQQELELILEEVLTLIYIDNVRGVDELQELLPKNFNKAKKVRLLLNAPNGDVRRAFRMNTEVYEMKDLPCAEAMILLKRQIYGAINNYQPNDSELEQIVNLCDRNPKLLINVARRIGCENDTQNVHGIVVEEREKFNREYTSVRARY